MFYLLIALTAGRGDTRNEVGLAAIDLQYPYLILCQISDCQTYVNTLTKINIFDPIEVLMPETICENPSRGNKLYRSIKEKFNTFNITPISRIHFNESNGMERVRTLCAREYSTVELIVKQKYYALAAAAALLKYVEYVQHMVYAPKSVRIEFQGSPNTTMIDIESTRSLELVVSQSKQSIVSLLGTMNRCLTPMGRRLLRASILQPSCNERFIADRQSCVAELVGNHSLCNSLQPAVQRLFGTDRLLALAIKPLHVNDMQNAERNLNYALLLKSCLDTIPELEAILAAGVHPFFIKMRKNLGNSEFRVMKDKISTLIHEDARFVKGCTSLSMQRCFAIKADINELLDVARQVYCELISDMKNMVEQLAVKHKLPLSLEYNINLGYHINVVIPRGLNMTISNLPAEFIQTRKNRRSFTMTTTGLLTLNKQCKTACEEIYMMSNTLLSNLLEDIRQHVGCLFQLSADVAELDLLLSLAQISCNPEYVRPSFGTKLELINSLHPIMELFNRDLPVANDVNASQAHNFHLITGPNMSGKSTYLKQIVLLQIMAQVNHCFETKTEEPGEPSELHLIYTHKLNPGTGSTDHYGIALAEVSSLPKCVTAKAREYASQQSVNAQVNNLGSIVSSLSWEKSCYDAVVQLRALLEDNRFTFANIINVMKQLDLSKQRKQTKTARIPIKSPIAQKHEEREKRDKDKNLAVATNIDGSTVKTTNDDVLSTELPKRIEKDVWGANKNEVQGEPMEIAEVENRKADLSMHEIIVNRTALVSPVAANRRDVSTVNPDFTLQSTTSDPRFYVCTSFAVSSPRATSPHRGTNPGSSFAASAIAASPSASFRSSQSFQYHDYCLSEGEFDITLPSLSTPSDVARRTALEKEARIFQQIEGDAFDERTFFDNARAPLELDLAADDDVVMLPV
ncbi:mutS protein homolog 4-like [Pogonomyrmex barbatus]|uniref:MutS protein homolog 4-like n=1 Tax=Pogonomyrmex barbatus TaxID=144034 RepID=A0A8N1S948_9HYME|nr:mutS protein homolog 4-like [Pogonomyrmex barbatus]